MRAAAARELSRSGMAEAGALASSGSLSVALTPREAAEQPGPDALNDALRYALFRRGLARAGKTRGFFPVSLPIPPGSIWPAPPPPPMGPNTPPPLPPARAP